MKKGFTLIELLIYLAITAAILTSFVTFVLHLSGGSEKAALVTQVNREARFALEFMAAKIRAAQTVIAPAPGTSASELTLSFASGPALAFGLDASDNLQVDFDPGPAISLTSDNLRVTRLSFTNLSPAGERANLRLELGLEARGPASAEFAASGFWQTAISLRK